jgi:hypothetical protein
MLLPTRRASLMPNYNVRLTRFETMMFVHDISVDAIDEIAAAQVVEDAYDSYIENYVDTLVVQGKDYGPILIEAMPKGTPEQEVSFKVTGEVKGE